MTEWQDLGQVVPSNQNIADIVYPIGAIYISVNSANPATLFGGTWQQLTDTFLYASTTADDDVTTAPEGQGEETHTLTVDEMPSHSHANTNGSSHFLGYDTSSSNTTSGFAAGTLWGGVGKADTSIQNSGGSSAHNNMPPYMKVYMWKRTG